MATARIVLVVQYKQQKQSSIKVEEKNLPWKTPYLYMADEDFKINLYC
jgi:hypothetical protein